MELKWLEDFLSLVETGNFSKSAEIRHVTQPAFSRRIKSLEHWIGTDDILNAIIAAELLMKKFISTSALKGELIIAHPQQPKLNQAYIFAGFLHARLAWIYQRKCHFLSGAALDEFNNLVLSTQQEIEKTFRPDQAIMLNARIDERQYAAILPDCSKLAPHIEYAIEMMIDDLPDALDILKRF